MATCKDCIHWAVCGRREKSISLDPMKSGYKCPDFKNKADVQEVKHGEWIEKQIPLKWCEDDVDIVFVCSVCKAEVPFTSKHCPECGAKMDGGAENDKL